MKTVAFVDSGMEFPDLNTPPRLLLIIDVSIVGYG